MKDYLNAQETNDFMTLRYITLMTQKMLEDWASRGNLAKEEITYLKYVTTYSEKFFQTVGLRLAGKEIKKINKRLTSFNLRFMDDYQFAKATREFNTAMENAILPRGDFDDFCNEIMNIECQGCDKDWKTCRLYEVFENNLAPEPTGYEKNNCVYAYDHVSYYENKKGDE